MQWNLFVNLIWSNAVTSERDGMVDKHRMLEGVLIYQDGDSSSACTPGTTTLHGQSQGFASNLVIRS